MPNQIARGMPKERLLSPDVLSSDASPSGEDGNERREQAGWEDMESDDDSYSTGSSETEEDEVSLRGELWFSMF